LKGKNSIVPIVPLLYEALVVRLFNWNSSDYTKIW